MTLPEILQFLEVDQEDDIPEALEIKLFTLKQEILQKPLLEPLLRLRIDKLGVLLQIEETFFPRELDSTEFTIELELVDSVVENWKRYCKAKNLWRQVFMESNSARNMLKLLPVGVEIEKRFATSVPKLDYGGVDPVFGKEPDPMLLEKGFRKMELENLTTFQEVKNKAMLFDQEFLVSLDRLSLISKYM
jgi:hypothetical protein